MIIYLGMMVIFLSARSDDDILHGSCGNDTLLVRAVMIIPGTVEETEDGGILGNFADYKVKIVRF